MGDDVHEFAFLGGELDVQEAGPLGAAVQPFLKDT